ncbi:MAG: dihydroorotate dehydrogenase [Planctomycetota bacterium]|nr:dihydroorotate dehydrogenase [Planctomycetota bacterium]
MVDLSVQLGALVLRNPLLSASGTFGHGLEMEHFVSPESLGGWVSKTVTLEPRHGNPAPRICETEAGFLNSIGLENRGVDSYLEKIVPALKGVDAVIFTNVGGASPDDFVAAVERLEEADEVDAYELNLSCPNVQGGKLPYGTDPKMAEDVTRRVRDVTKKPVFSKLSPNVSRISDMAKAVEAGGADGITAVNTLLGMSVDWRNGTPGLATIQGGYSGVGMKPVALRCAWDCVRSVNIPVIGCGGISTLDDVLEFLVVGCSAVQIGTASFSNPSLLAEMAEELPARLAEAGFDSVRELIGSMHGLERPGGSSK